MRKAKKTQPKTLGCKFKIKKDDFVVVTTGASKGQQGKVLKVLTSTGKVLVEGANMRKKHVRPNPEAGVQGGIVEREAFMDISNVALINPAKSTSLKADRVGYKTLEDGKKIRVFKSNGEPVAV